MTKNDREELYLGVHFREMSVLKGVKFPKNNTDELSLGVHFTKRGVRLKRSFREHSPSPPGGYIAYISRKLFRLHFREVVLKMKVLYISPAFVTTFTINNAKLYIVVVARNKRYICYMNSCMLYFTVSSCFL